jgi:CheY-specific phosphatase CheX
MTAPVLRTVSNEIVGSGVSALVSLLEEQALACFRQETRLEDLEIRDATPSPGPVIGQWLGVILLAGPSLRITVKSFFGISTIAGILAARMRCSPYSIAPSLVEDFVREFSNLYAGGVKRTLGNSGVSVGISLPLVTRGFDEVFNGVAAKREETRAVWSFAQPSSNPIFTVCVSVVLVDAEALTNFVLPAQTSDTPPADDMEFL